MAKTTIVLTAQDQTKAAFDSVQRAMDRLDRAAKAIGVTLSVGAFSKFVKDAIDSADEIGKLSQKVGVGVEALSGLKYAAELSNVSMETLTNGLGKLSNTLLSAATGGREQGAVLRALGVDMNALRDGTLTTEQAFGQIAKRVGNLADGWQKTSLLQAALGKSAKDLIPLLNDNADGFVAVRAEAEKLGVVISKELAEDASRFNDNITRLKASSSGLGLSIAKDLLPTLNDIVQAFVKLNSQKDGYGSLFEFLAKGLRLAAVAAGSFYLALRDMGDGIGALAAQSAALAQGDLDAVKAIGAARDEQAAKNKKQFEDFQASLLNDTSKPSPLKKGGGLLDLDDLGLEKSGLRQFIESVERETQKLNNAFDPILEKVNDKWLRVFQLAEAAGISLEAAGDRAAPAIDAYKEALEAARDETRLFEEETKRAQERLSDWQEAFNLVQGLRDSATTLNDDTLLAGFGGSKGDRDKFQQLAQQNREIRKITDSMTDGSVAQESFKTAASAAQIAWAKAFDENYKATRTFAYGFKTAMAEIYEDATNAAEQTRTIFTGAFQQLEDLWVNWVTTGKASATDLANYVIKELARIQAQQQIIAPLSQLLGGSSGALSSLIGGLFGSSSSGAGAYGPSSSGGISGTRALGGPVSAGASYLVGERGPEIFTPGTSGNITANGGGDSYYIDARNADAGGLARLEAVIRELNGSIENRAVNAVQNAQQRGRMAR